jgi:hypothetical protein
MGKVDYIRKNGKRSDIRAEAWDRLKHYNVTQGACSDGTHIYMAFEQKPKKGRKHRIKIVVLDPEKKKVLKVSNPLNLGHANDMCIWDGELLVTHSGTKKVVHRVNPSSLKKLKDITIKVPKKHKAHVSGFNGICPCGDRIALRGLGGNRVLYLDGAFNVTDVVKFEKPWDGLDSQGMDSHGGKIYRSYSKMQTSSKNRLAIFKQDGDLISKSKVEVTGELESVFFHGGRLYGTVFRKKKEGKKKRYHDYIFKAE